MTVTGDFERFRYFNFETSFLKNDLKKQNWSTIFKLKVLRLKKQHFHTKLSCRKPMLK